MHFAIYKEKRNRKTGQRQWYWRLRRDREIIAIGGQGYPSPAGCLIDIQLVKSHASVAGVVEETADGRFVAEILAN